MFDRGVSYHRLTIPAGSHLSDLALPNIVQGDLSHAHSGIVRQERNGRMDQRLLHVVPVSGLLELWKCN